MPIYVDHFSISALVNLAAPQYQSKLEYSGPKFNGKLEAEATHKALLDLKGSIKGEYQIGNERKHLLNIGAEQTFVVSNFIYRRIILNVEKLTRWSVQERKLSGPVFPHTFTFRLIPTLTECRANAFAKLLELLLLAGGIGWKVLRKKELKFFGGLRPFSRFHTPLNYQGSFLIFPILKDFLSPI